MSRSVEIEKTEGVVTVTTNAAGECVAVTRCDDEGRILKIIWERQSPEPGEQLYTKADTEALCAIAVAGVTAQEARTIRGLCDRLDTINKLTHSGAASETLLSMIRDQSSGFMPAPKQPRCTCRDFPGADEFCMAHKVPEGYGQPPTKVEKL